jgi:hypothetical protein
MPHLVAMQETYRDKGFEVQGLNVGDPDAGVPEPIDKIDSFAKKMSLNYPLSRISPDLLTKFGKIANFNGVPQSYLIDREGRLRGVFLGGGPSVIQQMKASVASVVAEG